MNDREKLIEIIGLTEYGNGALVGKNFQRSFIGKIAGHMIANGVTVQKWIPVSDRRVLQQAHAADVVEVVHCMDCKYYEQAKVKTKASLFAPQAEWKSQKPIFAAMAKGERNEHGKA